MCASTFSLCYSLDTPKIQLWVIISLVEKLGHLLRPTISLPGGACMWDWQGVPIVKLPQHAESQANHPRAGEVGFLRATGKFVLLSDLADQIFERRMR